jgi:hypothetical protein
MRALRRFLFPWIIVFEHLKLSLLNSFSFSGETRDIMTSAIPPRDAFVNEDFQKACDDLGPWLDLEFGEERWTCKELEGWFDNGESLRGWLKMLREHRPVSTGDVTSTGTKLGAGLATVVAGIAGAILG